MLVDINNPLTEKKTHHNQIPCRGGEWGSLGCSNQIGIGRLGKLNTLCTDIILPGLTGFSVTTNDDEHIYWILRENVFRNDTTKANRMAEMLR